MYSYANGTHLVGLWFRINVDLGCKDTAIRLQKSHSYNEPYSLSHKFYMEENNFILETPV